MSLTATAERPAVDAAERGPLQLGLFMPNCSYTCSISTYKPDPDDWTFESNLEIARAAEAAGFDFLFPIAKWRGYGGKTNYLGTSLETMTWASALLAQTSRIQVFSTVHVPIFHPFVAAKMGATLDHIGKGRWGLNVVSGWSEREFAQMGMPILPHADRYRRTEAYIEILKGLWTSEPETFSHHSEWYDITNGWISPMPTHKPHPPIANAGVSEDAKRMVARLCDWAFISLRAAEDAGAVTADIKGRAAGFGRNIRCATYPFAVWRETEREAEQEKRRLLDEMDVEAVKNWADLLQVHSGSYDKFTLEQFALGGGGLPIFGTAEQVAERLAALYSAGIDGALLTFLDFKQDTPRFHSEIMPLLRQLGALP